MGSPYVLNRRFSDLCYRDAVYTAEKVMELVQWQDSIFLTDDNTEQLDWPHREWR